jgi:hypothetical protein
MIFVTLIIGLTKRGQSPAANATKLANKLAESPAGSIIAILVGKYHQIRQRFKIVHTCTHSHT